MGIRVAESVGFQDIDVEAIERKYELYIDSGKEFSITADKADIEELHMGLGDDRFYQIIQSVDVVTDQKGYQYYQSFASDYEPPEPDPELSQKEQKLKYDPVNAIKEMIYKYQAEAPRYATTKYGEPRYIIMSHKMKTTLQIHIENKYITVQDQSCEYNQYGGLLQEISAAKFHGIPIAVIHHDGLYLDVV